MGNLSCSLGLALSRSTRLFHFIAHRSGTSLTSYPFVGLVEDRIEIGLFIQQLYHTRLKEKGGIAGGR